MHIFLYIFQVFHFVIYSSLIIINDHIIFQHGCKRNHSAIIKKKTGCIHIFSVIWGSEWVWLESLLGILDDFFRLAFQRWIIGPNDMHDSRTLAMYLAKLLFERLVPIFLPTSSIQFEPGIWRALPMSFPDSGESNFYEQFGVCLGLQDTEKRWALKRRVRGLNINKVSCSKERISPQALLGSTACRKGKVTCN